MVHLVFPNATPNAEKSKEPFSPPFELHKAEISTKLVQTIKNKPKPAIPVLSSNNE